MNIDKLTYNALKALERVINQEIHTDADLQRQVGKMEGKRVEIEITRPTMRLILFFHQGEVEISRLSKREETQTQIRGSLLNLMKLRRGNKVGDIQAEICGDIALGKTFQKFFTSMDLSWKDFVAYKTNRRFSSLLSHNLDIAAKAIENVSDTAMHNAGEYLQVERQSVISGEELDTFVRDVDRLRNRIDHLEVHIANLTK